MTSTDFLLEPGDADSKRAILRGALGLFVRDGLGETSIRAIAEATGYTNPALYKFFASKGELALYLFERCYLLVFETIGRATFAGSFEQRLGGLVEAWVRLSREHLEAVLFVNDTLRELWPKASPPIRRRSLLQRLEELVAQGQQEGSISDALDRPLAVATLIGTLGQVSRQLSFGGWKKDPSALAPQLTAILTAALTGA